MGKARAWTSTAAACAALLAPGCAEGPAESVDGELTILVEHEGAPLRDAMVDGRFLTQRPSASGYGYCSFQFARLFESIPARRVDDDGRARLRIPPMTFYLDVTAPGFGVAQFGPFEPFAVHDPLVLSVERGPCLVGRVRSEGRAVAGASVRVQRRDARERRRSTDVTRHFDAFDVERTFDFGRTRRFPELIEPLRTNAYGEFVTDLRTPTTSCKSRRTDTHRRCAALTTRRATSSR